VFKVYGQNDMPKDEIEPYFIGKIIAQKWAMANELYLYESVANLGFGFSYTEKTSMPLCC